MTLAWFGAVLGGLGLFLLGVRLMTDGLRSAAGRALERLLRRATSSRLRALGTGFGLTALVQSSSAVTVAAIGFVNAGLLELGPALWVVFGSNVGTTMTGWLVAITGVDVDVAAYALPMIGAGALARALGKRRRIGAVGQAVAGLGLFFLGVTILGEAFENLSSVVDLGAVEGSWYAPLLMFTIGALLTVAMQSSSAAMAVTLSAAAGGLIGLTDAGAMAIGANLGTTSTAVLAVIGATPGARRAAAGHVVFNLVAAAAALALLPWLLAAIQLGLGADGGPASFAPTLALFHTVFNVIGIVVMWPLSGRLERALARRWVSPEEQRSVPRYLDATVLEVPEVALSAATREAERLASQATDIVGQALAAGDLEPEALEGETRAYRRLGDELARFINTIAHQPLRPEAAEAFNRLLRARRHLDTAVEQALFVAGLRAELRQTAPELAAMRDGLGDALREAARAADPEADEFSLAACEQAIGRMNERYDRRREALLEAAADGRTSVPHVVALQQLLAEARRGVRHLARAAEDMPARPEPAS